MVLSYVAQSARGTIAQAIPQSEIDKAHTVIERMMIRWRGEPDPVHVRAIDAYFVSARSKTFLKSPLSIFFLGKI